MTRATLAEVLQPALRDGYAVAGLVVLGWEDARAYVAAAQAEGTAVILQAGPACRAHTPLPVLAAMFRHLAEAASVPVVAHLDHGRDRAECLAAIEHGFTSVMFDGSRLPLDRNIEETAAIAELARSRGVSCEGEVGFVGYRDAEPSQPTRPEDAARFARETGVDAVAVSVGNVHLQHRAEAVIDMAAVRAVSAATRVPLVIHGGSGVPPSMRTHLSRSTSVCKFNIGTEVRMAFGAALRDVLASDPDRFDRIEILRDTEPRVTEAARKAIRSLQGAATP